MTGVEREDWNLTAVKEQTLGANLRALRIERGMRLADLSRKTGFPRSTLSKIENGKVSLSYDKLVRLSQGFDTDIAQLLTGNLAQGAPPVLGRRSVNRRGRGKEVATEQYIHNYLASDLLNKSFLPVVAELRVRSIEDFGELIRHAGEECAYVLEGSVDLYTEHYEPVRLEAGDSIYFDSGTGHAYIAAAPGPCRILSICSAPEAEIIRHFNGMTGGVESITPAGKPRTNRGKR